MNKYLYAFYYGGLNELLLVIISVDNEQAFFNKYSCYCIREVVKQGPHQPNYTGTSAATFCNSWDCFVEEVMSIET